MFVAEKSFRFSDRELYEREITTMIASGSLDGGDEYDMLLDEYVSFLEDGKE